MFSLSLYLGAWVPGMINTSCRVGFVTPLLQEFEQGLSGSLWGGLPAQIGPVLFLVGVGL